MNEKGCNITFYKKAVQVVNPNGTQPLFKDIDYVQIAPLGDLKTVIERKVREEDKKEYPKAWAAYEAGSPEGINGMPLAEWVELTASQIKQLNYYGILSVESVAEMSDATIGQIGMGARALKTKAQAYLAGLDNKDLKIREMEARLAELEGKKAEEPEEEPKKKEKLTLSLDKKQP